MGKFAARYINTRIGRSGPEYKYQCQEVNAPWLKLPILGKAEAMMLGLGSY